MKLEELKLKSKMVASGVSFPDDKSSTLHNQFRVTIQRGQTAISFYYYDNMVNFEAGKETLTPEDNLFALRSFLGDCQAGEQEFKDFCGDFGYSTDSIKALRIWNLCVKAKLKILKLNICSDEITELLDELSKRGIE